MYLFHVYVKQVSIFAIQRPQWVSFETLTIIVPNTKLTQSHIHSNSTTFLQRNAESQPLTVGVWNNQRSSVKLIRCLKMKSTMAYFLFFIIQSIVFFVCFSMHQIHFYRRDLLLNYVYFRTFSPTGNKLHVFYKESECFLIVLFLQIMILATVFLIGKSQLILKRYKRYKIKAFKHSNSIEMQPNEKKIIKMTVNQFTLK